MKRALHLGLPLLALAAVAPIASADVNVFFDYTGIDGQLDAGWADAGLSPLTSAEREGIKAGIKSGTESVYAGFRTNFTTTNPGGTYETITFGSYLGAGFYGLAERIDWRNQFKDDSLQVSTRTHGEILSSSFSRAENLRRYQDGIANTVIHEFGHNVGLQHYDAYGVRSIFNRQGSTIGTYGNTGGVQNRSAMATGDTGATVEDYAQLPRFSELERMKLEFADGVSPALGLTINESATAHGTRATAQPLTFGTLSLSNVPAVNVAGSIAAGQTDWYSFEAFQGASFLANVLSSDPEITGHGNLDSILTLYDANGNVLYTNDDISYNGNVWDAGANNAYGYDSMILNYEFSAPGVNRYFLSLRSYGATESGAYNLLVRPVPEPATLAVLGLGFGALLRRRRK